MNAAEIKRSDDVKSPCISICKLNDQKICIGCFRSLDEIAVWSQLNALEKQAVLGRCAERSKAS